ncbi:hypothetical protein QNH08_gp12 [Aeromonas phage pAh6.2TG]|uniref:Uncharacterized protein n=2 Tax=Phayathaivirus TaxID=3153015 RepID=A0A8F3C942_9CAUD|nr:hypothetical protein QNH08_gp12 [Aeromonas phage pAh6.2TG]YP_010845291.1 hypothetical protein QNH09_gp09 [Aeromonas phage PVN03]QLI47609.1 hypothetical protein [Aeromonas phage PVN02]QTQ06855.1 hypothetical protein [Aeromonas phage PVN04]QTQ06791.1 hypothetical protein [Aeromonas phage PVN03]QWY14044.1 hypothetical protein [Aeromonas phage pAh6.2TG]CAC9972323.1 hypothetical protein PVN02_00056 [Aeromonas phage PVN02]
MEVEPQPGYPFEIAPKTLDLRRSDEEIRSSDHRGRLYHWLWRALKSLEEEPAVMLTEEGTPVLTEDGKYIKIESYLS